MFARACLRCLRTPLASKTPWLRPSWMGRLVGRPISRLTEVSNEVTQQQPSPHETPPIYRVVLTGGPCGGKTTALAAITERLSATGFRVYRVPEAASLLLNGGLNFGDLDWEQSIVIHANLMATQMRLEETFVKIAECHGEPAIIVCDRGVMDCSAYMESAQFNEVLLRNGWNISELRDHRYDCVIHLVSAAFGAEEWYNSDTNHARYETLEQARQRELQLRDAWVGCNNMAVIDNSSSFEKKLHRVVQCVCDLVGVPGPKRRRYFYVKEKEEGALLNETNVWETFMLEYTHLREERVRNPPHCETKEGEAEWISRGRLQRRANVRSSRSEAQHLDPLGKLAGVSYAYHVHQKKPGGGNHRVYLRRSIREFIYNSLLRYSCPHRKRIRLIRSVFMHGNRFCEFDRYLSPDLHRGLQLFRVEVDDADAETRLDIPKCLDVVAEVTHDERFFQHNLALERESLHSI